MAASVTKATSSVGRQPGHSGFERVQFDYVTGAGGICSDTYEMTGEIREAIVVPETHSDAFAIRLRDTADSSVDYLCDSLGVVQATGVQYFSPQISDSRPPIVAGQVEFHVSAVSGDSDAEGVCIFMVKS